MLSKEQTKILSIIKNYIEVNKISPTMRELAELTGLKSTSTVHGYIKRLEKNGYIKKHPTFPRSITILKEIEPIEQIEQTVSVPVGELKRIRILLEALGI